MSKDVVSEPHDPNKPIKFSTSLAGWNFKPVKYVKEHPWYKEVILWGTMYGFLIYLMFYREGNDIDKELEMPLGQRYLRVQEMHLLDEKAQLINSGHDGSSIDQELAKINALRKKYNYDS